MKRQRSGSEASPYWLSRAKEILVIWLLLSVTLALLGSRIGLVTTLPGPSSAQTIQANPGERIATTVGIPAKDTLLLVLSAESEEVGTASFVAAREDLVRSLRDLRRADDGSPMFERIRTDGHTVFFEDRFISADQRHLLIVADATAPLTKSSKLLEAFPTFVTAWRSRHPTFRLQFTSAGTTDNEIVALIHRDLDRSLVLTLPVTFLILVWAFQSFTAAMIPLVIALVSLIASLGVAALFSHLVEPISATSSQLVVLLVLAVGVDYSLFVLSRVREEVHRGTPYTTALSIARAQTGRAVFWSGLTVALSLLGLLVMNDSVLSSMALVSVIAVFITMISCLAVLPSILGLLAKALRYGNAPRQHTKSFQQALLTLSTKYPLLMLSISAAAILALASFTFRLELGTTIELGIFPESMESTQAFTVLQQHFPEVAGSDISVIFASRDGRPLSEREEIEHLLDAMLTMETVRGPVKVERSVDDLVARYTFTATGSGNLEQNREAVQRLRGDLIPRMAHPAGINAYLGGTLPYVVDSRSRYAERTPLVFAVVLGLSFLFLLIAFRSVVIPLKAIVLNLLSTGAAFGVLALIFELGILGRWQYGVIEAFVPALLFAILFGLSMDYHVFLLSRTQEEVLRGASTRSAVERTVLHTSRTITSAACIMVSVFIAIASLELPLMKELGVGLAVAVFLDATVIRSVLLPASMVLLNSWNWYLPRWLEWLPRFSVRE